MSISSQCGQLGTLSTGASGAEGFLQQRSCVWLCPVLRNNIQSSPVNDEVRPEVAHDPGHLPVVVPEVEDPGGEEVEELVAVGDAARDGRLRAREQEVPQRVRAVILERVEVVLRAR